MERNNINKEQYALEIFSSEAYLPINKSLLQHYGPDIAVFISNLIDKYKYFKKKNELLDGKWFYLLHEQQMEQTGLTLAKLQTCKKTLKDDKVLTMEKKGIPAKEYYCIDFNQLMEIVPIALRTSPGKTPGQEVPQTPGLYNNNKLNNYISVPDKVSDNDHSSIKVSKKERSKEYLPLAKQLSKIIHTVKNIKHTPSQLQTWAYSICQLVENSGIDRRRIRRALNWYEKHISDPYVPVIESGLSLKEKFLKLEAAMQRQHDGPMIDAKSKPDIYDDGIHYVWDSKIKQYVHSKTREIYIP